VKKYASILAVLVLLLGFAALSYAAPAEIPSDTTAVIAKGKTQITLGGDLRFRGFHGKNLKVKEDDTYPDSEAYYDYRVRLSLEAKVSPNTTGFVELESGDFKKDSVIWGSENGGGRGVYNLGNTKDSNVTIRQAWIQYQGTGLLGVPAGIKVGRQLLKLGYGIFYDHTYFGDDAIVVFVQPMKELTLAAFTIKWSEGQRDLNDDSTGYGILAAYAGKGFGLSADVTYVDDQKFKTPSNTDLLNLNLPKVYQNKDVPLHLWNFGLRGNIDDIAGTGLNFRADVEFQTGKVDASQVGAVDFKFRGWAALAGLDYKFKAIPLTLTAEYAIGSGDNNPNDNKIKTFITALGNEQHYTFVYEFLAPTAANYGQGSNTRTGLANTQYVKFGGAYDITKDLKAELYGYWLRAHKAVAIIDKSPTATPDKDLGWEVDAKVTYKIDKGLTYWIEGGYFWPGDAYKVSPTKDADDAWAVRHGIQLKF